MSDVDRNWLMRQIQRAKKESASLPPDIQRHAEEAARIVTREASSIEIVEFGEFVERGDVTSA